MPEGPPPADARVRTPGTDLVALSRLTDAFGRCRDLDQVLTVALDGLASLFGFDHSLLMMLDETGERLFTIASRGYEQAGIGSEAKVGVGVIGMVALQRRPMRVLNLERMMTYARSVAHAEGGGAEREIPLPGLPGARSQVAAPALVMDQLLGVLAVESDRPGAFSGEDETLLSVVAHLLATAIELDRVGGAVLVGNDDALPTPPDAIGSDVAIGSPTGRVDGSGPPDAPHAGGQRHQVRFFPVDGSTFVDGEYLIKGVPGRILWRLLSDHVGSGRTEFTNREIRLDPNLELPSFRDNLESRLILLKRRLEERNAPMRIDKAGRGRFRLRVEGTLTLERPAEP